MTTRSQGPGTRPPDIDRLWETLRTCPPLSQASPARDHLWVVVADTTCTTGTAVVIPYGSSAKVEISDEYAHDELIAAIEWLYGNEIRARQLDPDYLFATLRGIGTRSAHGSGRAAQADLLHGLTHVPSDTPVFWSPIEAEGAA